MRHLPGDDPNPVEDDAVPLPAALGQYRIVQLLGQGTMGRVYLAEDVKHQRDVALRQPRFRGGEGWLHAERFLREARVVAGIAHPNVCPIYDVGQIDDVHYLTMALIKGPSLAAMLRQRGCLDVDQAVAIVVQLAQAMHAVHLQGIVHHDLKPSNVLFTQRQVPQIVDFGLAPWPTSASSAAKCAPGTLPYLAPEQLTAEADTQTPASNTYSLGVVLYELLTGRLPVRPGESAAPTNQAPPRPSQYRSGLSSALEAACLRALAKRPEDRQPTMAEFAAQLTAAHYPDWSELQQRAFE